MANPSPTPSDLPQPTFRRRRVSLTRRIVEGQIQAFLNAHPDAVTPRWMEIIPGEGTQPAQARVLRSLAKRIVTQLEAAVPELRGRDG